MNLTTIFLAPSLNMEMDSCVKVITELDEGLSDVLTRVVPLIPLVVTSSFEAEIRYTHFHSSPQLLPWEFSSFCTSVLFRY
jgi:hypothetical protein